MEKLSAELANQSLLLPDLRIQFKDWPQGVNEHLDRLRPVVSKMITDVTEDEVMLKAADKSDMGHLTALWYPKAGWSELQVAAAYLAWVFIWDDEIDLGTTETAKDHQLGREYCDKSLEYIYETLGLGSTPRQNGEKPAYPFRSMQIFEMFGDGLRSADEYERMQTYTGLRAYITQVGVEHHRQLDGKLPSAEAYLAMRMGTAGVAPVSGCVEYMNNVTLPDWVRHSEEMETIGREATLMCLIINDLYSAPKEIASRTFQNYVVVLFNESKSRRIEEAVDVLLKMLGDSMKAFEKAAEDLYSQTKHDAELDRSLRACIDSHCHFVTGLIEWTLTSARYRMDDYIQKDGSFVIPLE